MFLFKKKAFLMIVVLLILIIGNTELQAQFLADFDSSKTSISKEYFISFKDDIKDICIAPANWKTKQWLTFSGVALSTAALFSLDEYINTWTQKNQKKSFNNFSDNFLAPWGNHNLLKNYTAYTLSSVYISGLIFKNEEAKMVAMEATKAWTISYLFIGISKLGFGRHRPYQNDNNWKWEGPTLKDYRSFASGHTIATFAAATVFSHEYNNTFIVPLISYSVATLVGLSQIYNNQHWASDVFAGAALGWAIGKIVVKQNNWGVKISAAQQAQGISLSYNF